MNKDRFEFADEELEKVVGGTTDEYNAVMRILRAHDLVVTDPATGKEDFVASFNKAMALDPTTKNATKFYLKKAELSKDDPNVYHFWLEGFGDLGPDGNDVLLAMLKGFFDD